MVSVVVTVLQDATLFSWYIHSSQSTRPIFSWYISASLLICQTFFFCHVFQQLKKKNRNKKNHCLMSSDIIHKENLGIYPKTSTQRKRSLSYCAFRWFKLFLRKLWYLVIFFGVRAQLLLRVKSGRFQTDMTAVFVRDFASKHQLQ